MTPLGICSQCGLPQTKAEIALYGGFCEDCFSLRAARMPSHSTLDLRDPQGQKIALSMREPGRNRYNKRRAKSEKRGRILE